MGYLLACLIVVIVAALIISTLISPGGPPSYGKATDRPVGREKPAADEPTPGASDTSDPTTVHHAQKRVPRA